MPERPIAWHICMTVVTQEAARPVFQLSMSQQECTLHTQAITSHQVKMGHSPGNNISLALQVNEAIKKSDVMGAANAAGMVCTDKDYVKIMKELCTSKGSNWSLRKDGQDENLAQARLV